MRAKPFTVLTLVAVVALVIPLASSQGQPAAARPAPAAAGRVTATDSKAPPPAAPGPALIARKLLAPPLLAPASTTMGNAHAAISAFRWVSVDAHPNGTRRNSKRPVQL